MHSVLTLFHLLRPFRLHASKQAAWCWFARLCLIEVGQEPGYNQGQCVVYFLAVSARLCLIEVGQEPGYNQGQCVVYFLAVSYHSVVVVVCLLVFFPNHLAFVKHKR
jgi:hypothetical protein